MEISLKLDPISQRISPLSYFQIGVLIIDVEIIRLH